VIYSKIRSTEEQLVSGRWRALTHFYTEPSTETWKAELYQKLQSILLIASWTARSLENEKSYGNRLPSIFRAIIELRKAIGENVTSADLEVFVFECDKIYDPAIMEDQYGDGRQSTGKRAPEAIAGTTGIGLGKFTADAKDAFQIETLLPAKIVLTSTMNKASETIQSARRRKKPFENTDGDSLDGRD